MSHELVRDATCKGCMYYRPLSDALKSFDVYACHFTYDEGELRGCPISACTRKRALDAEARKKLRLRKFNPHTRQKRQKATK